MLISMNAERLYELVYFYASYNNRFILVIDNSKWFNLDSAKQQEIRSYYEDVINEDEIGEIFANSLTFYKFYTQDTAIDTARTWFPLLKELDDTDFFIEAYVVTPSGSIPYTNKVTSRES